jgi:hypothetical protein
MTDNQITTWLKESRLPVDQVNSHQWQIQMRHQYCDYIVTIINQGNWFSFGADLIGDATGPNKHEFYKEVLELNGRLNGVHIALDNGRLALIRDDYAEDINKYSLYRSLNVFHEAHEYVFGELVKYATTLAVHLIDS